MGWEPQDAVAVVTGATSGIGRCVAEQLLGLGAYVVANGRREDRLSQLQTQLGSRLIPIAGDLTSPEVRQRVVEAAETVRDGQLDLLVNSAGVGAIGPFADATPERLRKVMEVNFFAPVELTRILLPLLRKGRRSVICNIGSVLGHRAVPNKSEYCASKFAIHGWSDSLRAELAEQGIQVTLVSPSTTASEFFDALVDTESSQQSKSFGSWTPDRVAKAAITAIQSRRSEVICSLAGKLLVYGDRISPPVMNAVVAKIK